MNKVSKIKVGDNLKGSIEKAVVELGGFGKFIKPHDRVLLKPNYNTADPFPASTDIEFLKAVTEIVYNEGAKEVMIGDSSTISKNTREVMEKCGVFDLEKIDKKPKIIVFEESGWVNKEIPEGKYLRKVCVPEILDKVDKLILLPCLKTHSIARYTGALKLSIGFMRPSQRLLLHLKRVQEKVADLNTIIKPDLIIMDGRKCFINHGPTEGEIKSPGMILASRDRVALDIEGIKIIQSYEGNFLVGIKPEELPQIKRAKELGIK